MSTVGGCIATGNAGDAACARSMLDAFDSISKSQGLQLEHGTFVLQRVRKDTSCEQIRAMQFQ